LNEGSDDSAWRPARREALLVVAALVLAVVALAVGVAVVSLYGDQSTPTESPPAPTTGNGDNQGDQARHTPPCSKTAAEEELTRRRMLDPATFAGVSRPICQDLTGDRRPEMALVRKSTGSAGTDGWAVLGRTEDGRWHLAALKSDVTHVGIRVSGNEVLEATPVYRKGDPNCCPSGGWTLRHYRLAEGKLSQRGEDHLPAIKPPAGYGFAEATSVSGRVSKRCGDLVRSGAGVYKVAADNLGCPSARWHARRWQQSCGQKRARCTIDNGFVCQYYSAGEELGSVTCRSGDMSMRFEVGS